MSALHCPSAISAPGCATVGLGACCIRTCATTPQCAIVGPPARRPPDRRPPCAIALLLAIACAAAAPALRGPVAGLVRAERNRRRPRTQSISCPTPSSASPSTSAGRAVIGDRAASHELVVVVDAATIDSGGELTSVSCASTALCVAVDENRQRDPQHQPDGRPRLLVETHAPERRRTDLGLLRLDRALRRRRRNRQRDPQHQPDGRPRRLVELTLPGAGELTSVSCASTALCVAVDATGEAILSTEPSAASLGLARACDRPQRRTRGGLLLRRTTPASAVDETRQRPRDLNAAAATTPASRARARPGARLRSTRWAPPRRRSLVRSSGLCVTVDGTGYAFASDNPAAAPPSWPASGIDTPRTLSGVSLHRRRPLCGGRRERPCLHRRDAWRRARAPARRSKSRTRARS